MQVFQNMIPKEKSQKRKEKEKKRKEKKRYRWRLPSHQPWGTETAVRPSKVKEITWNAPCWSGSNPPKTATLREKILEKHWSSRTYFVSNGKGGGERTKWGQNTLARITMMSQGALRYQFHVRLDAVKTGGFHCNLAGSIFRTPFIFSFSRRFLCCSMTASVRTIIQFPF